VAVRLRLKKVGRRHQPCFRVGVFDGRKARDGRVVEELGSYQPAHKDPDRQLVLKKERIEYWLGVGAKPTETVRQLLVRGGIAVK
jgi:small subunit ribosomal protein S16